MRTVYVPWSVALRDSERLLDDLSRYTKVDGIELLDHTHAEHGRDGSAKGPNQRVLARRRRLDLDLPVVGRDQFKAALKFMSDAKSRGFRITCNFIPLWLGTDKLRRSSLADTDGRQLPGPHGFPVYGCPNDREMRRYGEFMIRELIRAWPDMDTIVLNHLEYPHMLFWSYPRVDLDSMFTCFCTACEEAAIEQGLDLNRIRNSVKLFISSLGRGSPTGVAAAPPTAKPDDVASFFIRWPRLAQWLNFRMESMTGYARSLIAAGREAAEECNPKLKFGLDFQLPSLSPLLGTDFLGLSFDVDLMIPKFPDYVPGTILPMVAQELALRGGLDRDALLRAIREAFDLGPGPKSYSPSAPRGELRHNLLYSNAYDLSTVALQMRHLKRLVGKIPVQPHIWQNDRNTANLRKRIEALSRSGFDDFYLWPLEESLSRERLRALKGIL